MTGLVHRILGSLARGKEAGYSKVFEDREEVFRERFRAGVAVGTAGGLLRVPDAQAGRGVHCASINCFG